MAEVSQVYQLANYPRIRIFNDDGGRDRDVNIDKISDLPEEIKEIILGYLPITDAVATSALSREWRYTWTRVTQLNIDFEYDLLMAFYHYKSEDYLYRVVGGVLLSLAGHVHKCVMRFRYDSLDEDMNACLLSLSRKGIKDLKMESGHNTYDIPDLPSSIFQCFELSRLNLEKFTLKNSLAFKGFPNLVELRLYYVEIYGDALEKFISNCPLKILFMDSCYLYPSLSDIIMGTTAITSPSLEMVNIIYSSHRLSECCLTYTPNLRVASFTMTSSDYDLTSNCFDLLGSMPQVEMFIFDCRLHKTSTSDIIPTKLPNSLVNLKTLTLCDLEVHALHQVSFILCIIRSSPNLENLEICMSDAFCEPVDRKSLKIILAFLKVEGKEVINTDIKKLSVTLRRPEHIYAEIALLGIIVSWCPNLEKIILYTSCLVNDRAQQLLLRTAAKSVRSSSLPKIINHHPQH